ncbi:MAG: 23S rRNA (uracil(1939)-C(5))-methyltransferase RlmD, partial [Eubacterium sp.]
MKKGQLYQGTVIRLDFPNKGIVECEDGFVTVKGTLPGQKIEFVVTRKRTGRCEGRLKKVIEKSPLESIQPVCPRFAECGGCTYQTLSYENQLLLKEEQVRRIIDNVCSGYEFEGIIGSPVQWEYRNKMEFSFGDEYKDGPLTLGLHKRNSFHDIITADCCKIVSDDYNKILRCVLDFCTAKQFSFYHKMMHKGFLRHLLIRRGVKTGEIIVSIITSSDIEDNLEDVFVELKEKLLNLELSGKIVGINHVINDSLSDAVKCDRMITLYGQDYFYEEILGLKFKISTFSFFQTNSLGAEVLYSKAREYVGDTKDKLIFDLYSGTGTIAQILAPIAKKVIGVEIVGEAVEAARENAVLNGLSNCEFIAGDVLKVIDTIEDKPDIIVLDPPRDGIHPKALTKIIDYGVESIVYISCKPTSLARDIEVFTANGYKVKKVCAVDMFPGTHHVETVVKLSLKKDTPKIEVTMEPDEESNYTPEEKATYQKIKDYVKDKYGVNVHTSYIAQVKRMCGLDMGENYNKSKKENPEVKQCPQEKVEYI